MKASTLFMIAMLFFMADVVVRTEMVRASDGAQRVVFDPVKVDDPVEYYDDGSPMLRTFHYVCPDNTVAVAPYANPTARVESYYDREGQEHITARIDSFGTINDGYAHSSTFVADWPQPICITR